MTGNAALLAFQICGFIILMYLMHQMYDRLRRDAPRSEARPDGPESAHLRAGVGDLVRELRQAADQINADMAVRASTLQKLVDEANDVLKRLDAAAGRGGTASRHGRPAAPRPAANGRTSAGHPASPPEPRGAGPREGGVSPVEASEASEASGNEMRSARPARVGPASEASGAASRGRTPERGDGPWPGAPAGEPVVQVPRVAAASPAAASAYRQSAAGPFVSVDLADTGRFQAVRRLSGQGLSTTEIARTIGLGREEVELIMRVSGEAS